MHIEPFTWYVTLNNSNNISARIHNAADDNNNDDDYADYD